MKETIAEVKPFHVVMSGVTGAEQEYLFLNIKVGNDKIIDLHDKLYMGLLKQYRNRSFTYNPHLTVGCIKNKKMFDFALQETERLQETFQTTVEEIVVENIDETGKSIVELKYPLYTFK